MTDIPQSSNKGSCSASDFAKFQNAAATVRSYILQGTTYKAIKFSECGHLIANGSVGKGQFAFDQLHATIGSSTHFVEINARSSMNGTKIRNLASIALPSGPPAQRNRLAISMVNRINASLSILSQTTLNRQISVESNAVQLERAKKSQQESRKQIDARNRAIGAIAATIAANSQAPHSQAGSTSGRKYQCTLACSTSSLAATMGTVGESARDITVSVNASSASIASRLAMDDRAKLCRQANLFAVATIVAPSCR